MNLITIPVFLTENEIEDILKQLLKPSSSIQLDFRFTKFITPFASTLLILAFEHILKFGKVKINLKLADRYIYLRACMFILARLGFFDCLPEEITYYPCKPKPKGSPKGKNDAILEITRIKKQQASEILDKVDKAITINTDYSRDHKLDICTMVSEMIHNIFEHSEAPTSGIITIQNFENKKYMQMIIADAGVGIPQTISKSEDYIGKSLTDFEAILESVKQGVSGKGIKEDRGEGLFRCVNLANQYNAELFIRSNSGFANLRFAKTKNSYGKAIFLNGTQIYVNFPHK